MVNVFTCGIKAVCMCLPVLLLVEWSRGGALYCWSVELT